MKYGRLNFFISAGIIFSNVFAADILPALYEGTDSDADLPEYARGKTPWRCPENIKLKQDLKQLRLALILAETEGDPEQIEKYTQLIGEVKSAMEKWEKDSYDVDKKPQRHGSVFRFEIKSDT